MTLLIAALHRARSEMNLPIPQRNENAAPKALTMPLHEQRQAERRARERRTSGSSRNKSQLPLHR
jgi:hypothetical protein